MSWPPTSQASRSRTSCRRRESRCSGSSTCARRRYASSKPSVGEAACERCWSMERRSRAISSSPRAGASPRTPCSPRRAPASSSTPPSECSSPRRFPPGVEAVGTVTGDGLQRIDVAPKHKGRGKCFVCICEDVTTKDVTRAIAEGFDSIELAKRYTTVTMGPCQGKLCQLASIRLYAEEVRAYESDLGATTARPPWSPVEMGLLAGRHFEPARRTALHFRHEEAGAKMQWAGPWKRPYAYSEHPEDEVRAVHESLGVIDVSTLGKILVEGPEAAALLERLYPNRFADLRPGRIRYGVLTSDGGRIMDDGTVGRLSEELYYVTTTSTGADSVTAWFEWWNAVWGYEAEIVNVSGALAALNLAGPRAREALQRLTEDDVSDDALKYLDARAARGRGGPLPRAPDRLRRRARIRASLSEPSRRVSLGPARRRGRPSLRARAPADPPPREGARHRRTGHRLRVEPPLRGDAVAAEDGQGRLRRQACGRALRRA